MPGLTLAIALTLAAAELNPAQCAGFNEPGTLSRVQFSVGYRVVPLTDETRGRSMALHVWYPAAACDAPMSFGDYTATDVTAAPDADMWRPLAAVPMKACRDALPTTGPHPVLVGRHSAGTWQVQAEYLASHGYLVAMVASPGARIGGTPEERRRQIADQLEAQRRDLELALAHATRALGGDAARVGALGASDAVLLFAMTSPAVRAITLQDSGVFSDGMSSDAVRLTPSWQPASLRAPFLYFVTRDAATRETRLADFDAMLQSSRERVVIDLPGEASHEDLATSGYLKLAPGHDVRRRAFVSTMERIRAFLDAHVR